MMSERNEVTREIRECGVCEKIYEVSLFSCENCKVDVCINCLQESGLCLYCEREIVIVKEPVADENAKKCGCKGNMDIIRNCEICNDELCDICYNKCYTFYGLKHRHICMKHTGYCGNCKLGPFGTLRTCNTCNVNACESCTIALPRGEFICVSHAHGARCRHYNVQGVLCQVKKCKKYACFDVLSNSPTDLRQYALCDNHSYGKCKLCRYSFIILTEYYIYGNAYRVCNPCRYELHKKLITYYLCIRQKSPKELRLIILNKILK